MINLWIPGFDWSKVSTRTSSIWSYHVHWPQLSKSTPPCKETHGLKIKQPTLGLSTYLQSFPRIPAQIVVKFCKALKTTAAGVQHQVAKLTRRKEIAGKLLNSRHRDLGDSRRLHRILKYQSASINHNK